MKAIILGSTGMIGKSVLIECLESEEFTKVLVINRQPVNTAHQKLKEIIQHDFFDLSTVRDQLGGFDVCFFCMGISSVGMSEEQYRKITFDLTLNFARTLLSVNPDAVFCYVSGAGTDGTEKGRIMWARIKGMTENALLKLPFKDAYMFRPGYIQPLKGVKAKSALVNVMYVVFKPLYYTLKPFRGMVTDSVSLARAMMRVATSGYNKKVVEMKDINFLARPPL